MSFFTTSNKQNPLADEFINHSNLVFGENGALKHETSGEVLVDVFTNMLKETEAEQVSRYVYQMIDSLKFLDNEKRKEHLMYIVVMCFHKRASRESGEGCKKIFYHYFLELYNFYPETMCMLVEDHCLDHYGYYKDIFNIWKIICEAPLKNKIKYSKYDYLIRTFRHVILRQRNMDLTNVNRFLNHFNKNIRSFKNSLEFTKFMDTLTDEQKNIGVSLLSKYLPAEGRSFDKNVFWYAYHKEDFKDNYIKFSVVNYIIRGMLTRKNSNQTLEEFPIGVQIPSHIKKMYRLENSILNVVSDITEVKMCSERYDEIDYTRVPSLLMKNCMKAFLNEKLKKAPGIQEMDTGNRHPEDESRVKSRQNLRNMLNSPSKLNASQNWPHQIAYKVYTSQSETESEMFEAMWESYVIDLKRKLAEKVDRVTFEQAELSDEEKNIISGNILTSIDLSGSMTWEEKPGNRAIDVAIGMGLMLSEIANDNWKNKMITFSENPRVYDFGGKTVKERYTKIMDGEVGYSTNYHSVHETLIRMLLKVKASLHPSKNIEDYIPTVVVFSDGEFNEQVKDTTTDDQIRRMYAASGIKKCPTIVYWNLRSDRNGMQTTADKSGVQFLQGCSPNLFNYVLYGESFEQTEEIVMVDGKPVKMLVSKVNPFDTFKDAMNEPYYDKIRYILDRSQEKDFRNYRFSVSE